MSTEGLEKYASSWVLKMAGSLLVLSVAPNNIGFRLDKVLEACSTSLIEETRAKYSAVCDIPTVSIEAQYELNQIKDRLAHVESLAHEAGQ